MRRPLLALLAAALAACASVPDTDLARRPTYVNPVLDRDFPDPAVVRAADGWFYAYATQSALGGRMLNIQVARSVDLARWQHLGDALPGKPSWASAKQQFWAPHVLHDAAQEKYFMYYSAEPDEGNGKCLGVATARVPSGPFVDSGAPLLCGEGIEHIDPMAFDDPRTGKRLLYWGSGAKPIRVQELAPERTRFAPGSAPRPILFPEPHKPYASLIEGAWMIYRSGTYYLFYSGDRCCAREPRYAVMVARSSDALGPFAGFRDPHDPERHAILAQNGFWIAPGHSSVIADDAGSDWILYHAIRAEALDAPERARVMLLDRIVYRDGWPRIEDDQPSVSARTAPVLRPAQMNLPGPAILP
jgi:arabinan endo-1,5-alpha-L-arabinosidase